MKFDKDQLIELREHFRLQFQEHDFCIGQTQVERIFRELLGEPEPELEIFKDGTSFYSSKEIDKVFEMILTKEKIQSLFDRDDTFYGRIKK